MEMATTGSHMINYENVYGCNLRLFRIASILIINNRTRPCSASLFLQPQMVQTPMYKS